MERETESRGSGILEAWDHYRRNWIEPDQEETMKADQSFIDRILSRRGIREEIAG